MRFSILTVVLGSAFAMYAAASSFLSSKNHAYTDGDACRTLAQTGESEALGTRSEDVVLNARDLLEDLGMHARDLKGATLSVRRIEDLEARMLDLEADLEDLAVRAKVTKSDPFICPVCDETFATRRDLNVCINTLLL